MLRKRIALLERRQDMTFEQFDHHWATGHAEIIADLPGLDEYVQNAVVDSWTVGTARGVDGIVEVWFDDAAVSSPEQHTSARQQDDEVAFIRTLTAFTVTDRRSYDAEEKVWILAPGPLDRGVEASLPTGAFVFHPEPGAMLMDRPRLEREVAAPHTLAIVPALDGEATFRAVVATLSAAMAAPGTRVLRTYSRRVR